MFILVQNRTALKMFSPSATYKIVPFLPFMYRNYSEKAPGALYCVQQEKKRKKTIRIKVKRNKRSANLLLLKIGGSQRQYGGKDGVDSRLMSPQLLDLRTVLLQQLSPRVSSSLEATHSLPSLLQAMKVHQLRYWKMGSQSRTGNAGHQNRSREGQAHLGQHMLLLL